MSQNLSQRATHVAVAVATRARTPAGRGFAEHVSVHEPRLLVLALFILMGLPPASAGAQPAERPRGDAHATAAARATFLEGLACADRHDWPCAVERFGRARAVHASPVILSNHALALVHVGRIVEASETFRVVARDTSAPAALRADAERGIAELAPRIGHITIDVVGASEGVVVSMDQSVIDSALVGIAIPSDPGDHVIDAQRAGRIVASARVHLQAAGVARVELAIPAPTDARVAVLTVVPTEERVELGADVLDPSPPPRQELYQEWWLWTLVGVAAVGAGVGIGVGVALSSETSALPQGSLPTIDVRP